MGGKPSTVRSNTVSVSTVQDLNWVVVQSQDIQHEQDMLRLNVLHARAGEVQLFPKLEMLLNNGSTIYRVLDYATNALHIACRKGNLQAVRLLLAVGISVNSRDECGATALHLTSSLARQNKITGMNFFGYILSHD